jgi:hypothetical protein
LSTRPIPKVEYLLFVDEAGDDGLRTIRSIDGKGATDWFVLGGVLVAANRIGEIQNWIEEIRRALDQPQLKELHFKKLPDWKRQIVLSMVSKLPIRFFVYASNKRNMRRHYNGKAAKIPSQNWFYNFGLRILLEKVTRWSFAKSKRSGKSSCGLKIYLGERANVRHSQSVAYLHYIRSQSSINNLYIKTDDLEWCCYHDSLLTSASPSEEPGLQLADVLASAMYSVLQTLDVSGSRSSLPTFTSDFVRRIAASSANRRVGFGIKLMPPNWERTLNRDVVHFIRALDSDAVALNPSNLAL